jgi:hypothetical protein
MGSQKIQQFWIALLFIVAAGPAMALRGEKKTDDFGTFLEPYAAYMTSTSSGTVKTTGGELKYTDSGLAYGGRLGYLFERGWWIAADYLQQSSVAVTQASPIPDDYFGTRRMFFLDLGYKFPKRVWNFHLGLGFLDTWDIYRTSGDINYSGQAYKIGVGFRLAKHVSINFDYIAHAFTTVRYPTYRDAVADTYHNWQSTSYVFSISIPFNHIVDYP